MTVLAVFKYDVKPGRLGDFMTKLKAAADPRLDSPVMPQSVRLFRSTVPGPDTGLVILMIEYADMASYARARPAARAGDCRYTAPMTVAPTPRALRRRVG